MWGQPQDETQQLRFKQIDSLKHYFSTVKETTKDSLYEISILIPARKATITLRVNLPKDFPRVPPLLQIFPPVQHRLVDQQMYVTAAAHENLARWGVHCSLGKTVYEIVQKFIQEPPNMLPQYTPSASTSASTLPVSPPPANNVSNQPPKPLPHIPQQQHNQQQLQTSLPPIPTSFPELDSKTPAELSLLLTDETEFKKFFESLPTVQTMKKLRDDLRDNNETLAKKNLAKEAEIQKAQMDLSGRLNTIAEKRTSYEQKAQRQQEIIKQFSTTSLIDQLTEAASEAEQQSDGIAKKFLTGDMEHKDFIKDFMEKRKLFHLRSAKKESLMMLVR